MTGETYFEYILCQQNEDSVKHFCINYNILTNIVVNLVALLFPTGEIPGFKSRYGSRLSRHNFRDFAQSFHDTDTILLQKLKLNLRLERYLQFVLHQS
jgi:hypothetical protein